MYINSIQNLKNEVKTKIEESINDKLKCDILGIQFQETDYAGILSLNVVFKNGHGGASGLLQRKDDTCILLSPMKVTFNKNEDKKK